jgi:hypothetical protein
VVSRLKFPIVVMLAKSTRRICSSCPCSLVIEFSLETGNVRQHSTLFLDPDVFPDSVQDATIFENIGNAFGANVSLHHSALRASKNSLATTMIPRNRNHDDS